MKIKPDILNVIKKFVRIIINVCVIMIVVIIMLFQKIIPNNNNKNKEIIVNFFIKITKIKMKVY